MRKNIKIFLLFGKYSLKSTLKNAVGAISFLIGKILRFGLYFMFIFYLLGNTKLLVGYNTTQTIIFFLTFNIIDTLAQILFREVYRFRPLVVSGELDAILIKPYHPFMRILLGGIDFMDIITVFLYGILLIYFITQLSVLSVLNVLLFFALIINGLVIAAAFHIIVLALGILSTEIDHAIMIYRDLTRMGTLPVDIYAEPIRTFFTFVVPIGIMMTFPAKSLFGLLSGQFIAMSFAVSSILLLFSLFLWDRALKKYQSWGG